MVSFKYGGKDGTAYELHDSAEHIVIRTRNRSSLGAVALTARGRTITDRLETEIQFPSVGVEVLRRREIDPKDARAALREESDLRFVGRVLCDPRSGAPVVYTENIFVKLHDGVTNASGAQLFKRLKHGLEAKRNLAFSRNAYFLSAPEGTGQAIFDIAAELLDQDEVEFCHPELVRERSRKGAFPQQWHLTGTTIDGNPVDAHASVEAAWALSEGEGTVIAIIDDGVDLDHPEFTTSNKIVSPRDVTRDVHDARPFFGDDNHGTACTGVACADGRFGSAGVAPKARILPVRLRSGLGSIDEADAFYWAAKYGADVISCSWGPADGRWWDDTDPLHHQFVPLPDATRLAIDAAIAHGRNGRGCVITWAAGNGNESVDNDGYASYEPVTAVAACNDRGEKSAYSDIGDAIWCAFPSSHGFPSLTPGIWTTDRSGSSGYNPGTPERGDLDGNFTNSFGGTSSACPGAAGVAALVLARNPWLDWSEVKGVLRECCDKIDPAGGNYDANGHSPLYGYGRLNAETAVTLANP